MLLSEMNLEYDLILVDRHSNQQKSDEYLSLNPTGRIPTLVDNEIAYFESAAICLHLCEKHPEFKLIPSIGEPERAKCYQWLMYLTSSIQPELMLYFYPERHTLNHIQSDAIKEVQEKRIGEMFKLIDQELTNKRFLLGSNISVCDFFLFMLAHWASGFSFPPVKYKHLGRYLRELASRESVKKVCEIEGTSLEIYL